MKTGTLLCLCISVSALWLVAGCSGDPTIDPMATASDDIVVEGEGEGKNEGEDEGESTPELETVEDTGHDTVEDTGDTGHDTGNPGSCAFTCRSQNFCDQRGVEHSDMNQFCDNGDVCCEFGMPTDATGGTDTGTNTGWDTTPQDTATYSGACEFNCMRSSSCSNMGGTVHEDQYCTQQNRVCCEADMPTNSDTSTGGWPTDTGNSTDPMDTSTYAGACEFTCMSGWQCNQQGGTRHDDQYCDATNRRCCELPTTN